MKYDLIDIKLLSNEAHLSQVLTGFCLLEREVKDYKITYTKTYERAGGVPPEQYPGPFLLVNYHGKKIVYDLLDGYNMPEAIKYHLAHCDFYFKRSFSEQKNRELGLDAAKKMYPLGFNYHVSCNRHPLDKPEWKEQVKRLCGIESNRWSSTYFSYDKFEEIPQYKDEKFKVLFSTRLWGEHALDEMRIEIIRALKANQDIQFIGGITESPLARSLAPDLVVSRDFTERRNYLALLHDSDICIASTGLHESIGWKTGEYVASAKAIVSEKLHYEVPGNFEKNSNYLEFHSADECVGAVQALVSDPQRMYEMKKANREYYLHYLRPDVLIKSTLDIVD